VFVFTFLIAGLPKLDFQLFDTVCHFTRLPNMTNRKIHEVTPQTWNKTRKTLQRQAES
jgi:hypothetical protein